MKGSTWLLGAGGVLVFLLFLLVFPVLFLWFINSMAEAGGSTFYIEHTLWNYWVAFVGGLLLKGGS